MPEDPYAKFGGSAESDPYARFGGSMDVSGMEKLGALPGVGVALPKRLDNITPDPRGLLRRTFDRDVDAVAAVTGGGSRAIHANDSDQAAAGLHDALGGVGVLSEPLIGASAVGAPIRTALALGAATGAAKATKAGASALHVSEAKSDLAGDVAGILAGGGTMRATTPAALETGAAAAKGFTKGVGDVNLMGKTGAGLLAAEAVGSMVHAIDPTLGYMVNGGIAAAPYLRAGFKGARLSLADLATSRTAAAQQASGNVPLWARTNPATPEAPTAVTLGDLSTPSRADLQAILDGRRAQALAADPQGAQATINRIKALGGDQPAPAPTQPATLKSVSNPVEQFNRIARAGMISDFLKSATKKLGYTEADLKQLQTENPARFDELVQAVSKTPEGTQIGEWWRPSTKAASGKTRTMVQQRVSPTEPRVPAEAEDLSDILQQSLDALKTKKGN